MKVFFYGLFMDEGLLAKKDVVSCGAVVGYVDGYRLLIGERATLLHSPNSRAYGVVMDIAPNEVKSLYADTNVADYVSRPVTVNLVDGNKVEANCYNLPSDKISGTNKGYAKALLNLAEKLALPESYLDEIRHAAR